jgi:hypothetical protein
MIAAAGAAALLGCLGDDVLRPRTTRLDLVGVVLSAESGAPLAGARVDLMGGLLVYVGVVDSTFTDAAGAYAIRHDGFCDRASDSTPYYLKVYAPLHQELTSMNIGVSLSCTARRQRIDFRLPLQ